MKTLYTAEATATGGRQGHARTSDGHLDVDIAVPPEMGGSDSDATNPEQLFAAGYAACFGSALQVVAGKQDKDVSQSSVTARVGIGMIGKGAFGLEVELQVAIPGMDESEARALVERAHEVCPYSNATRGNIPVELSVEVGQAAGATA